MRTDLIPASAVLAANRISELVRETPLEYSAYYSELTGANVYLKLENLQRTGSFKFRGACNKLLSLDEAARNVGCVAASSGNHGAAVATAMSLLNVTGVIFVPEQASKAKVDAIRRAGGDVRFFGTDGLDTEEHARQFALDNGMTYLSPYNDADVVAGQGSCGVEIARQIDNVDALFIAVGGGGLISGVGSFLKSVHRSLEVVGCQPENSPVMAKSAEAGQILDMPSDPTLSDGTAGGIEAEALTFDICQQLVDRYVLVSEDEIADSLREYIDAHSQLIEGAAAVPIAALKQSAEDFKGKDVVIVVCGGNISRDTLAKVIC